IQQMREATIGEIDMRQQRILERNKGAYFAADGTTIGERPVEGTENPYRKLKAPSMIPDINALRSAGGEAMETELKNNVAKRISLLRPVKPPLHLIEAARKRAAEREQAPVSEKVE